MLGTTEIHTAEIILSLAGALILVLLAIIGYWIQKWIQSTDALTEAIQDLKVLFSVQQQKVDELQRHCDARCKSIDVRLDDQTRAIHEHTTEIALLCLKTKSTKPNINFSHP